MLEPSTKQVRGAEQREWPLFLWLFLLAAAPGNSGMPCQDQGKERDQGRETWAGICVPGKQGTLLALGRNQGEGSDAIRFTKAEFPLWTHLLCPVCGVTVLVITKPFVNKIFSSHFLCSATRLPCCNSSSSSRLSQASVPGLWRCPPCQPRTSV